MEDAYAVPQHKGGSVSLLLVPGRLSSSVGRSKYYTQELLERFPVFQIEEKIAK